MKAKNIFAGIATIAALLIATSSQAQQTSHAEADANATVVTPVQIVKNLDMNFGNLSVNLTGGGTVTLDVASGSLDRKSNGQVSLPSTSGTVSPASFTVTGEGGYVYTILISPSTITLTSGAYSMTAGSFDSYPKTTGTLPTATGSQTLIVGGVLTVNPGQHTGSYTSSTPLSVTVSYQ